MFLGHLEPEQRELFAQMIEAERDVPRDQRHWFLFRVAEGDILQGPWGERAVIFRDVEELTRVGLLRQGEAQSEYLVDLEGRARFFEDIGEPAARAEEQMRHLLDAEAFRRTYPVAYARWCEAEKLLQSAESEREFTTVGHKAREAMQEFATELVERYQPEGIESNAELVNRRVGAVIAMHLQALGEKREALLRALGDYSEATLGIIQRQEHGAQKEGEALTWNDARRVVLSVAVVLSEFATTVPASAES